MAIKVIGTTVIDDTRNLFNIVDGTIDNNLTVVGITKSGEYHDNSNRRLVIRDQGGTIVWGE